MPAIEQEQAVRDDGPQRGAFQPMSARPQQRRDQYDSKIEQLRVPPQSVDAEQAVLGGLMLDPNAFDRVADQLGEDQAAVLLEILRRAEPAKGGA